MSEPVRVLIVALLADCLLLAGLIALLNAGVRVTGLGILVGLLAIVTAGTVSGFVANAWWVRRHGGMQAEDAEAIKEAIKEAIARHPSSRGSGRTLP